MDNRRPSGAPPVRTPSTGPGHRAPPRAARHGHHAGQAGVTATFAPSTMGVPQGPVDGPPPGYERAEPEPEPEMSLQMQPYDGAENPSGATADETPAKEEAPPIYSNPNPDPVAPSESEERGGGEDAGDDSSEDDYDLMGTNGDIEVWDWTAATGDGVDPSTQGKKGEVSELQYKTELMGNNVAPSKAAGHGAGEKPDASKSVSDDRALAGRIERAEGKVSSPMMKSDRQDLKLDISDSDDGKNEDTLDVRLPTEEMIADFALRDTITPSKPKQVPMLEIPKTPVSNKASYRIAPDNPAPEPLVDQPSIPKPKGPAPDRAKTPKANSALAPPPLSPPPGTVHGSPAGSHRASLNAGSGRAPMATLNTATPVGGGSGGPFTPAGGRGPPSSGGAFASRRAAPPSGPAPPSAATPTPGAGIRKTSIVAQPPSRPFAGQSPHAVKETHVVKRERLNVPSVMHAQPTGGDWLKKRYVVNNYILLTTLGTGSYGEVRLCKDRTTDALFAIKIISKDMLKKKKGGASSETYFEDIKREIAIMKKLLHPNVLRLYEVLDDPKVNKLYLLLEYMKGGDLVAVLKKRTDTEGGGYVTLGDVELWNVFRQVAAGVRYLHYQNVVHGDIKPQNLLVEDQGGTQVVKIADFGISKMLEGEGQNVTDAAGTPAFMSPELCRGDAYSGQLADVWALGATVFMLKFGHPPFQAGNILSLYQKIQDDPLEFPPAPSINPGLRNLLETMMVKDPEKRSTLQQMLQHPWLRSPPTYATSPVKSSKINGAARVSGPSFTPSEQHLAESEAAMKKGLNTINDDDMFMSIGSGQARPGKKKRSLPKMDGDTNANPTKEADKDDDIMATKWGEDEFEMVDDEDWSEDGDDDDDDDEDVHDAEEKSNVDGKNVEAGNTEELSTAASASTGSMSSAIMYSSTHGSMDKEEENRRLLRFKKLSRSKGSSGDILATTATSDIMSAHEEVENAESDDKFEFFNSPHDSGSASKMEITMQAKHVPTRVSGGDVGGGRGNTLAGRRRMAAFDTPLAPPEGMFTSETHAAPFSPVKVPRSSPSRRRSTLKVGVDDEDTTTLDFGDFEKLMDTLGGAAQAKGEGGAGDEDDDDVSESGSFRIRPSLSQLVPPSGPAEHLRNNATGLGAAFYSEQGARDQQEDRCLLIPDVSRLDMKLAEEVDNDVPLRAEEKMSDAKDHATRNAELSQLSLACIFDGHSGKRTSQLLSQHFASYLLTHPRLLDKGKAMENALIETCLEVDRELCSLLVEEDDLSGSTCVCTVYDGRHRKLTVANIGDSMCVLSRGGRAVKMHRQHRLGGGMTDVEERRRVEAAGGRVLNSRVNGVLAVSRAFGDVPLKDYETGTNIGPVIAMPDVVSEMITPMTEFAVIGTDGLFDTMEPQQVVNFVRQRIGKKEATLQDTAQTLTREAVHRGSIDNVSVIILTFS